MKKWNAATVRAAKGHEKLGCVTAYDACFARLADAVKQFAACNDVSGGGNKAGLSCDWTGVLAAMLILSRNERDR